MSSRRKTRRGRLAAQLIALAVMLGLTFAVAYLSRFASEPVEGPFRAVDGDSLVSASGERLRLEGIDAPEFSQICHRQGASWPCGRDAARHLRNLVSGNHTVCEDFGRDRYDRVLVRCKKGQQDINRAMVEAGLAVSFGDYHGAEAEARAAGRGLWAGEFDRPQDWREINGEAIEDEAITDWIRRAMRFGASLFE